MLPTTIYATIEPSTIDRVSQFFNATMVDMLREVFQNARRAGATKIDVTTVPGSVRIDDNGCGIPYPEVLLAFGRSRWENRDHEDPAGMGMYALANNTCVISSKTDQMDHGWTVTLKPEHYRGVAPAEVFRDATVTRRGTSITIHSELYIGHAMEMCARYLPIEVYWNETRMDQDSFACSIGRTSRHEHYGLSFLIRANPYFGGYDQYDKKEMSSTFETRINFHGHVIEARLQMPVVTGIHSYWNARIDVHNCPDLKLVLPARKEVVWTPFLNKLRRQVETAIYETIEKCKPDDRKARLSHESWMRGCEVLGRQLPVPPIELVHWSPRTPENQLEKAASHHETVNRDTTGTLIVPAGTTAPVQVMLQQAVQHRPASVRLYEPNKRYTGFEEYRALPQIDKMTVETDPDEPGNETRANDYEKRSPFVKRIFLRIATRTLNGDVGQVLLQTNLAFTNQENGSAPEAAGLLLTTEERPSAEDIENLMMTAFYTECDVDESDTTQREKFREAIQKELESLLLGPDEAIRRAVHRALDTNLRWRLKDHEPIVIRYDPKGSCAIVNELESATN